MVKRSRYRAGSSAGAVKQPPRPPNVPNPAFGNQPPAMTPDIPIPKSRSTKFTRPAPPAFTADVSKTQEQLRLSNTMKNTQLNEAPAIPEWIPTAEGAKVPVGQVIDAAQTTLDAVVPATKGTPSPQSKVLSEIVPPPVNPSRGAMSGVSNFMMDNKRPIAIGAGGGAAATLGGWLGSVSEGQREYQEWQDEAQAQFDAEKAQNELKTQNELGPVEDFGSKIDLQFSSDSTYTDPATVSTEMSLGDIDMDNYDPLRGYKQLIGHRDSGEPIYQYLSAGPTKDGTSLQHALKQQQQDKKDNVAHRDELAKMFYDPTIAYGKAEKNKYREDEFGNPIKSSDIMRPEGWQDIALYGTDPKKTVTKTFGEFGPAGTPNVNIKTSIDFSSPFTTKSGKKEKNTPKLPWEF